MKKQSIQLQTIDACNAKCHKCPRFEIYSSKQIMTDSVFLKIVDQLNKHFFDHYLKIDLYLQNEPLLDPFLFKRCELLKKIFPNIQLRFSTNCMLVPKYKEEIIEYIDMMSFQLFGWDAESYNLIHRTNITQKKYEEMKRVVYDIRNKKGKSFCVTVFEKVDSKDLSDVDNWYKAAYSRAGFLSGQEILLERMDGCIRNKHKYFCFLYDGTLPLCCQDYLRESVIGNIKHQTLQEIIDSDLYKKYMMKVDGQCSSEENFICKKCELAKGKLKNGIHPEDRMFPIKIDINKKR